MDRLLAASLNRIGETNLKILEIIMKVFVLFILFIIVLWMGFLGVTYVFVPGHKPVVTETPSAEVTPAPIVDQIEIEVGDTPESKAADEYMNHGFFAHHNYLAEVVFFFLLLGVTGTTVITTMSYGSSGNFTGYSHTYIPGGASSTMPLAGFVFYTLIYFFMIRRIFGPSGPGVPIGHGLDFICHLFYVMFHWFV